MHSVLSPVHIDRFTLYSRQSPSRTLSFFFDSKDEFLKRQRGRTMHVLYRSKSKQYYWIIFIRKMETVVHTWVNINTILIYACNHVSTHKDIHKPT